MYKNNIKNVETFEKWVRDNCKYEIIDMDAFIDELFTQYSNSGYANYEMSKNETKSGNPESISYEVENIENEDGSIDTIIIFDRMYENNLEEDEELESELS